MIIVEPTTARFDVAESGAANDEHLLERISALENRVARLSEKLERSLDLLLRQAQNSHFDRALVKSLVTLLHDEGVIQNERLEQLWIERCRKDAEHQQQAERREELRMRMLTAHRGAGRESFEQSITEGFLLIDDGQVERGVGMLRRAAESSKDNAPLLSFLGEHFFSTGKMRRARRYFERALQSSPTDRRVALLLGLTCADEGETERAKELLNNALRNGESSFALHYGLGRVFAAEENWQQALHEFKLALASKNSPEAHYALGCLYFQLSRHSLAARHLRKALEMDDSYSEASDLLGVVAKRSKQKSSVAESFTGGTSRNYPRNRRRASAGATVAPLFRTTGSSPRKIITGGDRRLAEALRQDALNATSSVQTKD